MSGGLQGFGAFNLLHLLGEGEVCSVYRAVEDGDGTTGREVALAVVHPIGATDRDAVEAFLTRATEATGFTHVNVAAVTAAGRLEGRAYAVRELVTGASLDELVPKRSRGLGAAEAKAVIVGTLHALCAAAAHTPPLVHGRLDGGDVLVTQDGEVRVTGFGQSDADGGADLIPLARLGQSICKRWPPEIDAWLDRLQEDGTLTTPQDALDALRAITVDKEELAQRGLSRRVKRTLSKREPHVEASPSHASQTMPDVGGQERPTTQRDRRQGGDRRVEGRDRRRSRRRQQDLDADVAAGVRQARWVAGLCGLAVVAAVVIEITRHLN